MESQVYEVEEKRNQLTYDIFEYYVLFHLIYFVVIFRRIERNERFENTKYTKK